MRVFIGETEITNLTRSLQIVAELDSLVITRVELLGSPTLVDGVLRIEAPPVAERAAIGPIASSDGPLRGILLRVGDPDING